MPTPEETEQQRRKRLDELELYEKMQEKLLAWGKRRFWWVIALGGLTLGSGGYALVSTMLSGVKEEATAAKVEAKRAAEATANAEATAAKAATEAEAATGKAAEAVRTATEAAVNAEAATAQANAASKLARQSVDELAKAMKKFKEESQQLSSANEQLRKDLEAARSRFESDVAGLVLDAASIRTKADPEDESLQRLIKQLKESQSLTERAAAASALGLRGKDAKSAIVDLKAAFHHVRPTSLHSEKYELATSIARAIAQIDGEPALPFLLEVMADPGATFQQRAATGDALTAVPVWSKPGVEMLRSNFGKNEWFGRKKIIMVFAGSASFVDEAGKATALDLLIHALEDEDSNVVRNAANAIKNLFAKDGEKSLPALRKALNRYKDAPNSRRAVEGAINAIEGKKQD